MSNLAGAGASGGITAAARNALNAQDCKDLLEMLGLLEAPLLLAAKKRRSRATRRC